MLRLGKRPARKGAIGLAFKNYFDASEFPTPPLVFGKTGLIHDWQMFANDRVQNCVFAGAAHETMLWVAEAGGVPVSFSDGAVTSDYSAVTGYNARDPDTDQGTDMQQAAAYRQKVGILDARGKRHKVDSYVAIEPGEVEQLALATYLLGAVGVGIQFPDSAWDQFDHAEPWDVQPRSRIGGGHYIPCVGRNSQGNFLIVSWGRLQAVTPGFIERYMDEGVAYLSFEMLKDGKLSSRGFDAVTLKADLNKLRRG